jgi:hypothetical protein
MGKVIHPSHHHHHFLASLIVKLLDGTDIFLPQEDGHSRKLVNTQGDKRFQSFLRSEAIRTK